jgi:hypothetical protein
LAHLNPRNNSLNPIPAHLAKKGERSNVELEEYREEQYVCYSLFDPRVCTNVQFVHSEITEEIINRVAEANVSLSVMVCDDATMKIMSAVLKIHEINDKGVGAVLNVMYERERLPGTPVIYFLSPTKESIDAMIADYAGKKLRYGNAFLFTTGRKGF